jgi:hypothetical protein
MLDDRWQLISRNTDDLFGIIRDGATWLSTVELPNFGFKEDDSRHAGYQYESCIFIGNDSEVLQRYRTKNEAIEGHANLAKKFNLR